MTAPVKDCPQPDYPIRVRAYTPEQIATRESQGLPHHPSGTGWATCSVCDGHGDVCMDGDRTGERALPCTACSGHGFVPDGEPDPLIEMHDARLWRDMPWSGRQYAVHRCIAMRPSIGLLQLAMVERAIRCDVTMRDLVTTARRAA